MKNSPFVGGGSPPPAADEVDDSAALDVVLPVELGREAEGTEAVTEPVMRDVAVAIVLAPDDRGVLLGVNQYLY